MRDIDAIIKEQSKFRSKVKALVKDKGIQNAKYLIEYIEGHENPTALGVSELTKNQMISIINGVVSDKETEAYAKRTK